MIETKKTFGGDRATFFERHVELRTRLYKDWQARIPAVQRRSEHPGTAVEWEEQLYEVTEISSEGDVQVLRLEPWNAKHVIRTRVSYNDESERARSALFRQAARHKKLRVTALMLAPLTGALPEELQIRAENELGILASRQTMISAIPGIMLGSLGTLEYMAGQAGASLFGFPIELTFFLLYLSIESGVRLHSAMSHHRGMGSFPLVLPWMIWKAISTRNDPKPLQYDVGDEIRERDRFIMIEPYAGLLNPDEQQQLQRRFEWDAVKGSKRTAIFLMVFAIAAVLWAIGRMTNGAPPSISTFTSLLFAAGVLLEQFLRLDKLRRGEPAGSIFGILIRPFARKLLQGGGHGTHS